MMLNKKNLYELTNPQKSIWYTEQFYSNTNINNIVGYLKIEKNANLSAIEKAFNIFLSKNDSFKIKIICDDKSNPKQYFDEIAYQNLEIINLKNEKELSDFEYSFPKKNINILDNLLFKTKLLTLPNGSAILVLSTHHLISDAWTMSLCLEEIYDNYLKIINSVEINPSTNPSTNPSYIDFIKSQNLYLSSNKYEKDKSFWEEQFNTLPGILSFKNSSKFSIVSDRKVFTFNEDLTQKINSYCKKNSISDYVFLLSIFSVYFSSISNLKNFVLGNPILNRSGFKEKHTTGMFVSIMPFIVDVDTSSTFLNFCHYNSLSQKHMYRHISYPYHNILNYIKDNHYFSDSLYDVVFSYQNEAIPSYCKWLPNHSQIESLQIHIKSLSKDFNNLSIHYDFLTDIFTSQDIELMHTRIINLINQTLDNESVQISDLEIVSSNEEFTLLNDFNNTDILYDKNTNIVKEFENIVLKYPKKVAIVDSKTSLTYEDLNFKANCLAKKIIDLNIDTDIIAFSLPRSANIIISILAILKSGHTYMPIDTEYPIDRINFMLKNSNTKILISTNDFAKTISFNGSLIDFDLIDFNTHISNPNIDFESSKLAYIMYTSGSTGIPKAVAIRHYNVINFVNSMQSRLDYTFTPDNKVLSVTTVCFDIFVFEVYPTLLSGLTLVISTEIESKSPKLLSKLINKHKITKILTTPSRIELLFEDDSYLKNISSIKEFILGGEPLNKNLLLKLKTHTNSRIFNLYGPTETTVYSTFKDLTNSNIITIGKPINNTKIYILNSSNKLQPIGITGEICIGGDGVGFGYYNNPEKTSEVFVNNPYKNSEILYKTGDLGYFQSNGELVCLGRKDHQIKIRGYRVELDDISSNIMSFDGIENCAVVDKCDSNNKKYLCAYYVSDKDIDITLLKKHLVALLPNYMIPTFYTKLSSLPLTLNHKIDKKALPDPDFSKKYIESNYVAPVSNTEKNLCEIFKNCLNIEKIGTATDIFNFDIDSLELIKIQTKMIDFKYKLNTQDFYKCRTIKKLSELIDNNVKRESIKLDINTLSNINSTFNKHPQDINFVKQSYKNILITGTTGFLGMHLLKELLQNTDSHITCTVREKNSNPALNRLVDTYKFYFDEDIDMSRITVLSSDITKPYLGLDQTSFKNLDNTIDLVINTAANVRYYGNYSDFKKINIDVVDSLIKLCMINNKKLCHVSTLGVSGNYLVNHQQNFNTFDENDFFIGQNYFENVYIQTKFEAEKLIYEKVNDGLNASIYRVGNLTGRLSDGKFQKNISDNAFYNILRMILNYGIIPVTMLDHLLEFTPIDLCAKSIYDLIFLTDSSKFVFHIFNNNYISVENLLECFKALNYNTSLLSGIDFKEKIIKLASFDKNKNMLKGIVNDLDDELGLSFNSTVNQKNIYTNNILEKLDFHWNMINYDYIKNIVTYMKKNNII